MRGIVPLSLATGEGVKAEQLVVPCFQGEAPPDGNLPPEVASAVRGLAGRPGWQGREGQVAETGLDGSVGVVSLHGLGKREDLDALSLRFWLYTAVEAARTNRVSDLALTLPEHHATAGPGAPERVLSQLQVAGYRFQRFLTQSEDRGHQIRSITFVPPAGKEAPFRDSLPASERLARAVALTRDLCNSPPNEATPEWMEEQARAVAAKAGLAFSVFDSDHLASLGMGGILAVGAGSAHRPRLLRLAYGERGPAVALVGNGVTFDTGGISIKPAAAMDEMKYDKGGACTALAVAALAAELGLSVRLTAYLPIAENMPDGGSYRPGDIIRCYNGKTVEIINTDAEGRLLLADALSLAVEEGAEHVLEYSTLTGACTIALGRLAAGLYTPDDALAGELLAAAEQAGERLWRMPLWPELFDLIKGNHADLKNSSERWGSSNLAATFLAQFVEPLGRWAHLDIAGPVNTSHDGPGGVGATGYGVALSIAWLRSLAGR